MFLYTEGIGLGIGNREAGEKKKTNILKPPSDDDYQEIELCFKIVSGAMLS